MVKSWAVLSVSLFIAVFSLTLSSASQLTRAQVAVAADAALPSPFLVAVSIIGLVALGGALLSLYFGRRHRSKQPKRSRPVAERFWAID